VGTKVSPQKRQNHMVAAKNLRARSLKQKKYPPPAEKWNDGEENPEDRESDMTISS